jgi:hypothetical protein
MPGLKTFNDFNTDVVSGRDNCVERLTVGVVGVIACYLQQRNAPRKVDPVTTEYQADDSQ